MLDTAARNGGLCMPCKRGTRKSIEAGKRYRDERRIYEQSAERKYWLALVGRVHDTPDGFEHLRPEEKTYFAVSCLIGEVHNGGFEQFFYNSSGSLFGHAMDGLIELDAAKSVALLVKARDAVFADSVVPRDRQDRFSRMLTNSEDDDASSKASSLLNALDKEFCMDEDGLTELSAQYAVSHGFYSKS